MAHAVAVVSITLFAESGVVSGALANERFPAMGPTVTRVVLASVALFGLVGPLGTRSALEKSGEIRPQGFESAVSPNLPDSLQNWPIQAQETLLFLRH